MINTTRLIRGGCGIVALGVSEILRSNGIPFNVVFETTGSKKTHLLVEELQRKELRFFSPNSHLVIEINGQFIDTDGISPYKYRKNKLNTE